MKPYVIGIAGESGVGKSTITRVIQLFYGIENTTVISTDDLHKWERTNHNWNEITHLNPKANNLELGDMHLQALSKGESVYRSIYNHNTGTFNPPIKVQPKRILINQGLHAFYTSESQKCTDLKVFLNTDDDLRTHWKIIRDTEKRGYKYNEVLDAIAKRRVDAQIINQEQLRVADVVVYIRPEKPIKNLGDRHEIVNVVMESVLMNHTRDTLFTFLEEHNTAIKNFVQLSNSIGSRVEDCQAAGGNISIKVNDKMIIKSSGYAMKDISYAEGHTTVEYNHMLDVSDEDAYNKLTQSDYFFIGKRPSMEVGFHAILGKYVLHSHPIYLTSILCMQNSEEVVKKLYSQFNYAYIGYISPGYDLYESIKQVGDGYDIYFLENHGVIINSETFVGLEAKFHYINDIAKKYITKDLKSFDLEFANIITNKEFMFPDAVILNNNVEVIAANNYINYVTKHRGRSLSKEHMVRLLMMESEKYRKSI